MLRFSLCLGLVLGTALGQPQRRPGAGLPRRRDPADRRPALSAMPYFLLENFSQPCDVAIEDDEPDRDIEILNGPWVQVCETEVSLKN